MDAADTPGPEMISNPPVAAKPSPSEYVTGVAAIIAQYEAKFDGPVIDVPSSKDLRRAGEIFETLQNLGDSEFVDPVNLNCAMQELGAISDKWIDPEQNPVYLDAYNFLEGSIHAIGRTLDEVNPESKELRQRWNSLRVLNHCMKRTLRRKELNPSLLTLARRKLFRRK